MRIWCTDVWFWSFEGQPIYLQAHFTLGFTSLPEKHQHVKCWIIILRPCASSQPDKANPNCTMCLLCNVYVKFVWSQPYRMGKMWKSEKDSIWYLTSPPIQGFPTSQHAFCLLSRTDSRKILLKDSNCISNGGVLFKNANNIHVVVFLQCNINKLI